MKKLYKRILSMVLAITLLSSFWGIQSISASAADQSRSYSKKMTVYMPVKAGISLSTFKLDIKASGKVNQGSVKSSNKSVASFDSISNNVITLDIYKAGTTKISFKVGGKSYKVALTVKKHTNPLKTLKISGFKSGKNLVGKRNRDSNGLFVFSLNKNIKNSKLTVKAKSGWVIQRVTVANNNSTGKFLVDKRYYNATSSNLSFKLGTLKKSNSYSISISFLNKKNGGIVDEYYILNSNETYLLTRGINGIMLTYL